MWSLLKTTPPPPKLYNLVAILVLSISLSACGFHLRGLETNIQADYKSVRLLNVSVVNKDVQRELLRQFASLEVKVVDNIADAELELDFKKTQFNTSITGRTGQGDVESELLKMSQSFSLFRVASEQKLAEDTVSSFRDRRVNANALQASSRELRTIKQQMAADIAQKVVTRINYALKAKPKK